VTPDTQSHCCALACGSLGVPIDGKNVSVQVGMNLTVVGSKEAAKGDGGGGGEKAGE